MFLPSQGSNRGRFGLKPLGNGPTGPSGDRDPHWGLLGVLGVHPAWFGATASTEDGAQPARGGLDGQSESHSPPCALLTSCSPRSRFGLQRGR